MKMCHHVIWAKFNCFLLAILLVVNSIRIVSSIMTFSYLYAYTHISTHTHYQPVVPIFCVSSSLYSAISSHPAKLSGPYFPKPSWMPPLPWDFFLLESLESSAPQLHLFCWEFSHVCNSFPNALQLPREGLPHSTGQQEWMNLCLHKWLAAGQN